MLPEYCLGFIPHPGQTCKVSLSLWEYISNEETRGDCRSPGH